MERKTIDFGIDLGTTNSAVAVIDGVQARIIKNNLNMDYTPSAVYIDKTGRIHVGQRAKERLLNDENDAYTEFKRDMGTDRVRKFLTSGIVMKPEGLSAEVLKSLKTDVANRLNGEIINTATITVPAAFELPQIEATKRAAQLAGLENCQFLQEPIAAALAYGFQNRSNKVFWMVYDFGGGTFDAAILNLRDGEIKVINHYGDNFLGGKDLDWLIVEQLIVPEAIRQFNIENFSRKNDDWKSTFAKMKNAAENAKIQLSIDDSALLIIDDFLKNQRIDFEMVIKRCDVAQLALPLINKSIKICREVIKESKLATGDIEKLILVGGPTMAPYLRDHLSDPKDGLGIPLEYSVDPLTVVAQGAAIYAGSQLIENRHAVKSQEGEFSLDLEYQPIGSDTQATIGGIIKSADVMDCSSYTLEISSITFGTGRIPLSQNGSFITSILAEEGKQNKYKVSLYDGKGNKKNLNPSEFTYTVGNVTSNPPLTNSLGVALSNNEVQWFLKKGQLLPAKSKPIPLKTDISISKGESKNFIDIPIVSGEDNKADLNRLIDRIKIPGENIKRDVPFGSDVEVTVEIDKSQIVVVRAFIPILDLEQEVKISLMLKSPDIDELTRDLENQIIKLEDLINQAEISGDIDIKLKLHEIYDDHYFETIEDSIDGDEPVKAEKYLLELKRTLSAIETQLEWPVLISQAENEIETTNELIQEKEDNELLVNFLGIENQINEAIESSDLPTLKRAIKKMHDIRLGVYTTDPEFWVGFYYYVLENENGKFVNTPKATELIHEGARAIENDDIDYLKAVLGKLLNLLPRERKEKITKGFGSSVSR